MKSLWKIFVFLLILAIPVISMGYQRIIGFVDDKYLLSSELDIAVRYEYWDWFTPVKQTNDNHDYDYSFTRSRIALKLEIPYVTAFMQVQDVHMWGLPDGGISSPPAGALGGGAIYFAHGNEQDYHSTAIRQAYIEMHGGFLKGFSAKAGRFDYTDGLEVIYSNKKLGFLKKMRIAERMIGPFIWSSFWRSFDGIQSVYDHNPFNLTGILVHPTQGGFENDIHKTIDDITLYTMTGTFKYDQWIPNSEIRLFHYYYDDNRDMQKPDNTGVLSKVNTGDINIHTFGMHWLGLFNIPGGILDILFWGAIQEGEWGELNHKAWAGTFELGYQLKDVPMSPWIRAGYCVASGDKNPSDSDHTTFYQLVPTSRKYAFFPFYNMMNSEDIFIQAVLKPFKNLTMRIDGHILKLYDGDDRWYMGAGPTAEAGKLFGYLARPAFGDNDLGKLLDTTVIYQINPNVSCMFYYGHVFGDDVIDNIYPRDKDADYTFVEMRIKF